MSTAKRLVTSADIDSRASDPDLLSIVLLHELEFMDGHRVVLLDDRGWGSTSKWTERSEADIRDTSRMVVGPDAPPAGVTEEEMENLHWMDLQKNARRRGVTIDASELRRLPHDMVLSARLLARIHGREGK